MLIEKRQKQEIQIEAEKNVGGGFMKRLNIRARIWLLNIGFLTGMVLILVVALKDKRDGLEEMKIIELKHLIEAVHVQTKGYFAKSKAGEITEAEAKSRARQAISQIRYDGDNYIWVNNEQGTFLVHPHVKGENARELEDIKGDRFAATFTDNTIAKGEALTPYWWKRSNDGPPMRKLAYTKLFEPWGWVIGTGIYVDKDLDEKVIESIKEIAAYGLVVMGLLMVVAMWIGTSITKPLRQTVQTMKDIGSGEGDLTVRLPASGKNEIAELAESFNIFVTKIQKLVSEVEEAADSVATRSEELSSVTTQSKQTIQNQSAETEQIASAINEMSSSVHEVAANTSRASDSVKETTVAASAGRDSAAHASQIVNTMHKRVSELSEVTRRQGEESNNIGAVLDVIHSIAEQTNLLALNAAIEAARAGESGRGFAVVADEVRELANRTEKSTNEISGMIENLQSGAREVEEAMDASLKELGLTITASQDVDESLNLVFKEVDSIDGMMAEIATASEQQASVAEEISKNVSNIVELSQENSEGANHITNSSKEIAVLSEKLAGLVRQFRV